VPFNANLNEIPTWRGLLSIFDLEIWDWKPIFAHFLSIWCNPMQVWSKNDFVGKNLYSVGRAKLSSTSVVILTRIRITSYLATCSRGGSLTSQMGQIGPIFSRLGLLIWRALFLWTKSSSWSISSSLEWPRAMCLTTLSLLTFM